MCNTWVNCMQGRVEKGLWEIRAQEVRRREILLQVRVFCPHFTSLLQLNFMQGSVGPSICAFIWHIGCLLRGAQYLRFVELVDKLSPNAGGSSPTGPFEEQGRGAADQCQGLLPVSWGNLHWPNRRRQVCINLVKSPREFKSKVHECFTGSSSQQWIRPSGRTTSTWPTTSRSLTTRWKAGTSKS